MRTLIRAKFVYAPGFPDADSLLIDQAEISWVGQFSAIKYLDLSFDQLIELPDYFVTPGFVDSHVHLSATGALDTGVDLRETKSAKEALSILKSFVQESSNSFILGHGWEDTNWPDRQDWNLDSLEPDLVGRNVYLSRIDVHSALIKTPIASGIVKEKQHHQVRKFVQDELPQAQRRANISAALAGIASKGIVSVHENGGPAVSGKSDFLDVMDIAKSIDVPEVFGYWGTTDLSEVQALNAFGAAGDLTVDGSIGSRTALLSEPYADDQGNSGVEFLSTEEITEHFIACTDLGIQGGFHAIGDQALHSIALALEAAQKVCGIAQVRAARHRIEHAEMLDSKHFELFSSLGVVLSMQPVFDELWGNQNGLYEQRLKAKRASQMNTFASIAKAGITMAFSSDSPVTPIDPWRTIQAAIAHHTTEHRISARAAFTAHTRGGWRAVKDDQSGVIEPGALAHLASWSAPNFSVTIPADRIRAWSTDERSGTPPLPDLADGLPRCIATIRSGRIIYDSENIWVND
jgi:predicted amidohydrolase YtcJ